MDEINLLKITCPRCKNKFDAGQAFNEHLLKSQQEEVKKASANAEEKYKSLIEEKDEAMKKKDEDFKKLQEEEVKKSLDEQKKQMEVKHLEDIRKKEEEIEKKDKEHEITNRRLSVHIEEINSLKKNGKVELQGEIQEERLQDFLRKKFPDDDLEEIKKGAKGGDCILSINHKFKKNIAKIYFECKDTKVFNENWADKLLEDMKDKGISNGIIVTSPLALPTDFDKLSSYVERHGNAVTVIPMSYPIIHAVVNRVRSILILKSRENKDHEIPEIMQKCWENLNSPNFSLPIRSMVGQIRNMEIIFRKEKDAFERSSANKERTIRQIQDNLISIVTSFTRSVGDIFPEDLLVHEDDKLLEDHSDR